MKKTYILSLFLLSLASNNSTFCANVNADEQAALAFYTAMATLPSRGLELTEAKTELLTQQQEDTDKKLQPTPKPRPSRHARRQQRRLAQVAAAQSKHNKRGRRGQMPRPGASPRRSGARGNQRY